MTRLSTHDEHRLLIALNKCSTLTEVAEAIVQEAAHHAHIAAFYSYYKDRGIYRLKSSKPNTGSDLSLPPTIALASDLEETLDGAPTPIMMFDGETHIGTLFVWTDAPETVPTDNWDVAEAALKRVIKGMMNTLEHGVLRVAPKTMTEGILAVSTEGELIYYSPQLEACLGWSEAEVREHGWTNLVYPDPADKKSAFEAITALMLGKSSAGAIRTLRAKDGSDKHMEIYSSVVRNPDFGPPVMVGILRDLTDALAKGKQKKLNEQLTQLGRRAGIVAHDFNNLLCAVMGHSDLLMRGAKEPAAVNRHARTMFEAATKGARMTQQLMSFGGTSAMRTASISASSETSRTVSLMEPELPENISVRLSFAEGLPPIEADAAQLQQAILNLLTNARDAMPTGGDITISTWLEGEMIGIGIEDEGEGFSDIALSRLFDETVFTNKALFTTKALGHGLGLPATKVMAEAHGGSLTVENLNAGGAKVCLFIPMSTRPEDALPELVVESIGQGEIVWFIDDDETITEFSRLGLMMQGLNVSTFSNGDEAIKALNNASDDERPSLLVLDLQGHPGGTEVYKLLKNKGLDTPVLWTSGFSHELSTLPDISRSDFLQKPFSSRELASRAIGLLAN